MLVGIVLLSLGSCFVCPSLVELNPMYFLMKKKQEEKDDPLILVVRKKMEKVVVL